MTLGSEMEAYADGQAGPVQETRRNLIKEAGEYLKRYDLVDNLVKEIQKNVEGEEDTIKALLLVSHVRLVRNALPTSSNLHINDESGLGKDHITKAVLSILPEKHVHHRTKISPEAFTYWKPPNETWNGDVVYLEDATTALLNHTTFKVMSSGGSKASVVIKQKTYDIDIPGKPVMLITSYDTAPNSENLRRFPICFCDSTKDQTKAIMERQARMAMTGEIPTYDPVIKTAMELLAPYKVVIPFADKLPNHFPASSIMRTHFPRLLDLIKASAILHQMQRKITRSKEVIATGDDFRFAQEVLLKTTTNSAMVPLTKEEDNVRKFFSKNLRSWFSVGDIEAEFPQSQRWLYKTTSKLRKYGFLVAHKELREGVKQPVLEMTYNEDLNIKEVDWRAIDSIDAKDANDTNKEIESIDANDSKDIPTEEKDGEKPSKLGEPRTFESIESFVNDFRKRAIEIIDYLNRLGEPSTKENLLFHEFNEQDIQRLIDEKYLIVMPDGKLDVSIKKRIDDA